MCLCWRVPCAKFLERRRTALNLVAEATSRGILCDVYLSDEVGHSTRSTLYAIHQRIEKAVC
jgi:hypothetical protein